VMIPNNQMLMPQAGQQAMVYNNQMVMPNSAMAAIPQAPDTARVVIGGAR
jgi:hypothetical protein